MHSCELLIVHVTDAHIKSKNSIGLQRIYGLAASIGGLIDVDIDILLLFSGDVAFSGIRAEYDVAAEGLEKLRADLLARGAKTVHIMLSPGNHDCDFKAVPEPVRAALLASPDLDGVNPSVILDAFAATQSGYFEFSKAHNIEGCRSVNSVIQSAVLTFSKKRIRVTSLNTSITSMLHEAPGTLRIPSKLLEAVGDEADVSIVIAHHPLNWFLPKDAVAVSEWLDRTADMVLFGHEHRIDDFIQLRKRIGSTVNYFVGLPLEDNTDQCGFRCIRIDLEDMSSVEFEGRYEGAAVVCQPKEIGISVLCRNTARDRGMVSFTPNFTVFLSDPGAGFTHPRVNRQVELDDIFVPAEFRHIDSDKASVEHVESSVSQGELSSSIFKDDGRYLVFGGEQAGKTTFAKKIILEARARRLIPIYLDIARLRSLNKGEIRGWFKSAISHQFDQDCQQLVDQALPADRLVIIDNAQAIPGGTDGIEAVISFVGVKAHRVVVLTAENPAVSILSAQGREEYKYWRSTKIFELLPLGHKRRGQLIRKWVSLGRAHPDESHRIEAEVRQIKKLLDRALGKSSLPKYPLFILVLLQQLEGLRTNKTSVANGSHGYLFEALVNQSIDRHVRSHEIGAVTDFLAAFARMVWQRDGAPISSAAVNGLLKSFLDGLVEIDGAKLLDELDAARIIISEGDIFRFRYQYVYYYYLAKWANVNARKPEGNQLIESMVSLIHTEMASNVLMFLAHFGHEQLVIDHVVPLVESLFSEQVPCQLEKKSSLSLRYSTAKQRAVLLQGPPEEVSDEHNFELDQHDEKHEDIAHADDSLKLNTTLKALQVLGQVLKSRATSMPPDQMIRVANASMLSAQRFMSFAYGLIEENAEQIVHGLSEAFKKAFKISKPKAVEIANILIGALVLAVARIGIIRAADTMAAAELNPLLKELEKSATDEDTKLILLVARVIGDKNYPKESVEDYVNHLSGANVLPVGVLATAVAQRFYLEPPSRSVRESACNLLGIDVKKLPPKSKPQNRIN